MDRRNGQALRFGINHPHPTPPERRLPKLPKRYLTPFLRSKMVLDTFFSKWDGDRFGRDPFRGGIGTFKKELKLADFRGVVLE